VKRIPCTFLVLERVSFGHGSGYGIAEHLFDMGLHAWDGKLAFSYCAAMVI
jgi:hypothetical protein